MSRESEILEIANIVDGHSDNFLSHRECLEIATAIHDKNYRPHNVGKWIRYRNKRTCSYCSFIIYSNGNGFNYCPDCGASMRGGAGNE